MLATLAVAADHMGAASGRSAAVNTPVANDSGRVLLLFPDAAATELCALLGGSLEDPMGRSTLAEVGNILAASYLRAIMEMIGLELEPEPPTVEVGVLGTLVEQTLAGANPNDPTILMRSCLTVEAFNTSFAFLFVPQIGFVKALLASLDV
jgi:chemotaxis protein CheY-P-specific phosphatase CheC